MTKRTMMYTGIVNEHYTCSMDGKYQYQYTIRCSNQTQIQIQNHQTYIQIMMTKNEDCS